MLLIVLTVSLILSTAANSRLANSLGDLYGGEMEEPTPTYSPPPPPSSPRSPASPRGPRMLPQDPGQYVGSSGGPSGKNAPGPQAPYSSLKGPYSGLKGPYSGLKGPYSGLKAASGRYLSRSIPVSTHYTITASIATTLSQLA